MNDWLYDGEGADRCPACRSIHPTVARPPMGAITTREISAAPAQAATHAPCDDEPAHGSHPSGQSRECRCSGPTWPKTIAIHMPQIRRGVEETLRCGWPCPIACLPSTAFRGFALGDRPHADRLRAHAGGSTPFMPQTSRNNPLNHAGRDLRTGREPAWLIALVVDRRQASGPSARLAMQKVEGSSPFIRFGKAPETGLSVAGVGHEDRGCNRGCNRERIRSSEPDVLESVSTGCPSHTRGSARYRARRSG